MNASKKEETVAKMGRIDRRIKMGRIGLRHKTIDRCNKTGRIVAKGWRSQKNYRQKTGRIIEGLGRERISGRVKKVRNRQRDYRMEKIATNRPSNRKKKNQPSRRNGAKRTPTQNGANRPSTQNGTKDRCDKTGGTYSDTKWVESTNATKRGGSSSAQNGSNRPAQ